MKASPALIIITFISCCLLACQKKEGAAPIVKAKTQVADTLAPVVVTYPYTDTFIGQYSDLVTYDDEISTGTGDGFIEDSAVFIVIHPSAGQVVFASKYLNSPKIVNDTFATNDSNTYQAALYPAWSRLADFSQAVGDHFLLTANSNLIYNWSYSETVGCSDYQIHTCAFSGAKKRL